MEEKQAMQGIGTVVGKIAPDFELLTAEGEVFKLSEEIPKAPLLLVFYPRDFTPVCTKQMCNYRDFLAEFERWGVRVIGISKNDSKSHGLFQKKYDIPFPLLSDPSSRVAKLYKAQSFIMLGAVSRAIFILNTKGTILYRYVEPTILTHRSADEIVKILKDLKSHGLI